MGVSVIVKPVVLQSDLFRDAAPKLFDALQWLVGCVSGEQEPTAMVLATSDGEGFVTSRTVLLKALDENGFVFFFARLG